MSGVNTKSFKTNAVRCCMKGNKYNIKNLLHLYAKMFSVQASGVFSCRAVCNPPLGLCSEADVSFGQWVDEMKGVQDAHLTDRCSENST